ncbi:molecular chaperone [Vibrio sp. YMD68]|uniref:TorD/DmsD family molecular chaperone n=1 Tax=Vibrio sp. YMD68 TaxID=3042300 RepID=UPI00249B7F16|nr:molecular chaperone [Vibrio sp. YMD68]WGV99030.1 molecular chaperone [Vibrio sp. YMD68]
MDNQYQEIRADIYLLIATLFRQAPSAELIAFLTSLDIETESSVMQQAWQALKQSASTSEIANLNDEYQELFIGIGRGEVVPFGSWHMTGSLMEKPLAQLRQDLTTLGFEREDSVKEPEDHISALCEVMALLINQEDPEQQAFFNAHLAPWYSSLSQQIKQASHAQFYVQAAQLLEAFLSVEKVRFSQKRAGSKSTLTIHVNNTSNLIQST